MVRKNRCVTQKDFGASPTILLANPSLSPNGQKVIFTRQSGDARIRNWIMSLSGARAAAS